MGALSAIVLGLCSSGDHIVAQRQLYAGTQLLLQTVCPRFGIGVTFVDGTEPGAFAEAVLPGRTVLVMAETPANPKLAVVDLAAVGAIAGPMTVVDSTFATPLAQRPAEFGVDLVVHSATKAIAGHNDATSGWWPAARNCWDGSGLRRAPRRGGLPVRRSQRPAGRAHPGGAPPATDRDRHRAGWGVGGPPDG